MTGCDPSSSQVDHVAAEESVLGDEARGALLLLRASRSRGHIRGLGSSWASWDAFADHHYLDPMRPNDADLVAFVHARAMAGASWGTIQATLTAVRVRLEGTPRLRDAGLLTVAATRHLNDLFGQGAFDPAWQAPVLTVGQVVAMVQAAGPRDGFLVAAAYLAGLRPGEWTAVDLEHFQVDARGVKMLLPHTKTGRWQKVQVEPLPGTPLDVVALAQAWLTERGGAPGPLVCEPNGDRLGNEHITAALRRVAAAAGITEFSPYSLRRSMAVHADLLGVPGRVVRQRLRHAPDSQTYRRYIEPLLALMDRDGAAAHYLNPDTGTPVPVRLDEVTGNARRVSFYAFAAGSLTELLDGLDLPSLRVPKGLVDVSRSGIESGQAVFRRWAGWARQQGWDPTGPPVSGLTRWVVKRLGEVDPVSVETELNRLHVGWLDATGSDGIPGWDTARAVATSAANEARAARAPRYKSRPATGEDRVAVCTHTLVGEPPAEWAVACLAWATGASVSIEVLDVSDETALVRVDGVETRVQAAPFGLVDPVSAADRLDGAGVVALNGPHSAISVWEAGRTQSEALRDRLAVVLLAGSGTRPSDIARARVKRVEEAPGGLAVFLGASKGRKPGRLGRDRLIWAPHRDGAMNPVDAWAAWRSWHPASADGPLLPKDVLAADPRGAALTASAVSKTVGEAITAAGLEGGLTAYGFRYGRAQEMHDEGLSDETVAEALGHDDLRVTYGYIQGFDPFADGLDAGFANEGATK